MRADAKEARKRSRETPRRSSGEQERCKRNWGRQYPCCKNRKNGMLLRQPFQAFMKALRQRTIQQRLSAFFAGLPCNVAADDAAEHRRRGQQQRITVMRHQQEQQQICASGDWKRDRRRIQHGNGKQSQPSQMRKPMRDKRMLAAHLQRVSLLPWPLWRSLSAWL